MLLKVILCLNEYGLHRAAQACQCPLWRRERRWEDRLPSRGKGNHRQDHHRRNDQTTEGKRLDRTFTLKTFVVDDLSCCITALLGLAFRVSPTSFSKVSYHLLFDFSERYLTSLKDIDYIFE